MSKEILEMAAKMGFREIETKLILQCSPFIVGLRPSSLLIIPTDEYEALVGILENTSIEHNVLLGNFEKIVVLLYDVERLEQYLMAEKTKRLLFELGYKKTNVSYVINKFIERYKKYNIDKSDFPHEMGIVLGYPVEDVEGFIKNEGRNFLYSGYWKVYENIEEKKRIFRKFEKARDSLMVLFANGINVKDIINIYNQKIAV